MEKIKVEKIADTLYVLSKFEFDLKEDPNSFLSTAIRKDLDLLFGEVETTRETILLTLTKEETDYIKSVFMSRRITMLRNYKDWCFVGNQKKLDLYKNDAAIYQKLILELQKITKRK